MDGSCWETTTPDWVFGLFLGCGVVALSAGAVWVLILSSAGSSPPPRPPRMWWRYLWLLGWIALLGWNLQGRVSDWASPQDAVLDVAVLLLTAAPVLISYVWVRRAVAAGGFPPARQAPFGAYWLLPALFLVALTGGVWTLALQVASERPC